MKKSLSKAWILLVTFVIAFCFIVPTASAAAEPTKLPIFWGFEDPERQLDVPELMLDYHGFMHDGNGASEIQSKVVYEGKYAMKCDAKDLVWGMVLAPTLQKGKTYIFSVYIKTEDFKNNNGYNLYSRVKRPVEMYLSDSLRLEDGTADWKKYEIKFKALQDGLVDLGIQPFEAGAKPTGILYFDNIELKEEGGSTNSTAAPTTKAPTTKAPSTKAPTTAVVQPTATDTATTESDRNDRHHHSDRNQRAGHGTDRHHHKRCHARGKYAFRAVGMDHCRHRCCSGSRRRRYVLAFEKEKGILTQLVISAFRHSPK